MKALLRKIRIILRNKRTRRLITRTIGGFAAVIIFITTYALILPAITMEAEADCGIEAHQHDDSCYEEVLICTLPESGGHHHTKTCYNDSSVLVCGLEETEGHTHDSSCYEKVLVCDKEVHTHSAECYRHESESFINAAVAAGPAAGSTVSTATEAASYNAAGEESSDSISAYLSDSAVDEPSVSTAAETSNADLKNATDAPEADSNVAATSADSPVPADGTLSRDSYVPALDPLDFDTILTDRTGIYSYAPSDGEVIENSSAITEWKKTGKDTELGKSDILRVYLAYTIPAGALNETNETARYRLPANLHLTDDQVKAINESENGITGQYINYDTLEITDSDQYHKYLGAEAVEGTRTPSDDLAEYLEKHADQHDGQEYISAVVKVEDAYDDQGDYLGQDLVFTFTPYSVQKNRHEYDSTGQPTKAGRKISGWFTLDFNMEQVDWSDPEVSTYELTAERSERTADVVFVTEGTDAQNNPIHEIHTKLTRVEETRTETVAENTSSDKETVEETDQPDDSAADDTVETAKTAAETSEELPDEKKEGSSEEYKDGTLTSEGNGYKITLDYTTNANIPENATLSVREITAERDGEAYEACLEQAKAHASTGDNTIDQTASRFFDIEIFAEDESGEQRKIEPSAPVSVNIQLTDSAAFKENSQKENEAENAATAGQEPTILHFTEEGVEQVEAETTVSEEKKENATEIQFEAESFSVYGVIYTVDFEYSVNGKIYQFSLPGGGFVSLEHLVEVLGIANQDEQKEFDEEIDSNTSGNDDQKGRESTDITFGDVEISEETRKFVSDVENVENITFSDPEVLWIGRINEDTDLWNVIESNEIAYTFSGKIGSDELYDTLDTRMEAGDWTLISQGTFTDEEELLITMKNGDTYSVAVKDEKADEMKSSQTEKRRKLSKRSAAGSLKEGAAGVSGPQATKTLESNDDGTYTMTLSVQAPASSSPASKANIVIIYDTSNSMHEPAGNENVEYVEDPNGVFGLVNGKYVKLSRFGSSVRMIYFYNDENGNRQTYCINDSKPRYTPSPTRMIVANNCLTALGDKLFAKNTPSNPDQVEVAFVEFATQVKQKTEPTTSQSDYNGWVGQCFNYWQTTQEGDHYLGATNWEGALDAANSIKFGDDDPTYIIFISDGNPTARTTECGPDEPRIGTVGAMGGLINPPGAIDGIYGTGNSDDYGYNFTQAQIAAGKIHEAGKELYSIGIFGDADRMQNLDPQGTYFEGTDRAAILSAFDNIFDSVSSNMGYTDVSVTDGITSMTSTAIVGSGRAQDFVYKLVDKNGNELDFPEAQKTAAFVESPDNEKESGKIHWDLGEDYYLIDGATYSVSFVVWPDQDSYDLVADLNNGKRSFDQLNEVEASQVVKIGSKYKLRTNTSASASFTKTTEVNGQTTKEDPTVIDLPDPDPMILDDSKVTVQKRWSDSLAQSEYNQLMQDTDFHVWLNLMREGTDYLEEPVIISKPDNYMDRIWPENDPDGHHISTGLMVSEQNAKDSGLYSSISNGEYLTCTYKGKTYYILDPGYDYYFEEHVDSHTDYHFELENKIFHPMVVDGEEMDVTFNGDTVQDMVNLDTLTAVNSLKGGINIRKKIVDENGNEIEPEDLSATFEVHGSITKNGEGTVLEYRYFGSDYPETGSPKQTIQDSSSFTLSVKVGETLRIINVPSGYTYSFYEVTPSEPYEFYGIEGQAVDGDGNVPEAANIEVDDNGVLTGVSVSNAAQDVTVKNTQKGLLPPKPGSLLIRKSISENGSEDVSNAVKEKLAGDYTFDIYKDEECTEPLNGDDGTPVKVKITMGSDCESVTSDEVTGLEPGDYWIKETLPTNDSQPVVNPVKVTVQAGNTGENAAVAEFTNNYETTKIKVKKQWTDVNPVNHSNDTITFALYQVAEDSEGNVLKEGEYGGTYTNTITGTGEVTIEELPVKGTVGGTEVTYHYYVSELSWPAGYVPVVGYTEMEDGQEWTLNNVGPQPPDKTTSVNVTKEWKDQDGNDLTATGHDDDVITFKLTQTAVESDYVPVTLMLHNSNGSEYSNKTYYVKKGENGASFTLTLNKPGSLVSTGVTVTTDQGEGESWINGIEASRDFTFRNIASALLINASLYNRFGSDSIYWDNQAYNQIGFATYWSHSVSGTDLKNSIEEVIASESGGTAVSTQDYIYTLHKSQLEGAFTPSAEGWVGTIADLPLYKKIDNSTYYVYSYKIDEITVNGETVIDKNTADGITTGHTNDYAVEVNQSTNTITNTERPKVDVEATKAWLKADDTTTAPTGGKVTFELYADGKATGKTVELDGTVDTEAAYYESVAWKALWKDLPKYSDYANTQEINYVVKEVSGFAPYVNQNPDGVASGETITNMEMSFDLEILKVDKTDSSKKLENATFALQKIKSHEAPGNAVKYDGEVIDTRTTYKDGKTKFNGIAGGYYEVREIQTPAGYVTSGDNTFYIKVDKDGVHLIQCDLNKPATEWNVIPSGGIVSVFTAAGSETPAQVTVTNEPGSALPSTGGPGTRLFTILGSILIFGAGVLLYRRRRIV